MRSDENHFCFFFHNVIIIIRRSIIFDIDMIFTFECHLMEIRRLDKRTYIIIRRRVIYIIFLLAIFKSRNFIINHDLIIKCMINSVNCIL